VFYADGPDKFDGIEFEQPIRLARRVEHTTCGITVRARIARIIPSGAPYNKKAPPVFGGAFLLSARK